MEPKRAYSAKGVLTALGKSLLYLLFFLAIQFLAGIIYAVIAVAGARRGGRRKYSCRYGDGRALRLPADCGGDTAVVPVAA